MLVAVGFLHEGITFAKLSGLPLWLLCAALTASICRKLFGELGAALALLLNLLYIIQLYIAGTLYPQTLASTLFLLSLWLHLVWRRSGQISELAAQALIWAGLVLAVPTFLFNMVVYVAWLAWTKRDFRSGIAVTLVVFLAVFAWSERNKAVFHSFFLSDNTGLMLFLGNSEATGPNTGPTLPLEQLLPKVWHETDELVRDNGYKNAALAWIRAHPQRAASLYVLKTLNWFGCETRLKSSNQDSSAYGIIIAAVYYPMLFLAILSPLLLLRTRPLQLLFALHYGISALVYAIFFTRIRYRLPFDYLLLMLAAGSVAALLSRQRRAISQSGAGISG